MQVQSLASLSGLRIGVAVSCGEGHRHGSDLELLWLWRRLAATALTRPLAWESPYPVGVALKRLKKKKYIYIYINRFYSTRNSTQYSVITYMGKKYEKGYMYMSNSITLLYS